MIGTFTDNARAAGLSAGVIAPVRPTWKERYPLIPIEEYMLWRRDDGTHLDPWLRIHELVGGEILGAAPRSMVIRAPATEWAEWTGMALSGGRRVRLSRRARDARGRGRDRHARRAERLGAPPRLARQRDQAVRDHDQSVALERAHGLVVERVELARLVGDEPQSRGASLSK